MADTTTDGKETGTPPDSSPEETKPETPEAPNEESEEREKFIPRGRFDKVYAEKQLLKKQLEEMSGAQRAKVIDKQAEPPTPPKEETDQEKQARETLKKWGYVHESDMEKKLQEAVKPIYQKQADDTLSSFYKDHPDISPSADPQNIRWKAVEKRYKSFQANAGSMKDRLEWAYKLEFGDVSSEEIAKRAKNQALIDAKKAGEASLGGGGSTTSAKSEEVELTPAQLEQAKKMRISPEKFAKYIS